MSLRDAGRRYVSEARRLWDEYQLGVVSLASKGARAAALALGAATLAACAQSSVVSQQSNTSAFKTASLEPVRLAPRPSKRQVVVASKHSPVVSRKDEARVASQGVASFYSASQKTASGEQFDANELTAAHPTLPFGTRVRVTNVNTGKSVTVRVNDRGPYVEGRIVDVSYAAAESLGMVDKGIAKVRLDVVQ